MRALELLYPDMVRLFATQDEFGLPSAGKCSERQGGERDEPCKVWVLEVGNVRTRTEETPRLFFSGALHGDERIGPTALLELACFLLGTYKSDPWVKILLETRVLVLVPAANAVGYQESRREELGVDPNRDFAFDTSSSRCMQSVAARSVNEVGEEAGWEKEVKGAIRRGKESRLSEWESARERWRSKDFLPEAVKERVWRRNVFSLAVTFHGGDNLIAHPWGDTKHCPGYPGRCRAGEEGKLSSWIAPDHTAMAVGKTNHAFQNFCGE
eukprot:187797-Hanusia_phi.AAC.1